MLKITTLDYGERTVFELEGKLAGPWVDEMKKCWRKAAEANCPATRDHWLSRWVFADDAVKLSRQPAGDARRRL